MQVVISNKSLALHKAHIDISDFRGPDTNQDYKISGFVARLTKPLQHTLLGINM